MHWSEDQKEHHPLRKLSTAHRPANDDSMLAFKGAIFTLIGVSWTVKVNLREKQTETVTPNSSKWKSAKEEMISRYHHPELLHFLTTLLFLQNAEHFLLNEMERNSATEEMIPSHFHPKLFHFLAMLPLPTSIEQTPYSEKEQKVSKDERIHNPGHPRLLYFLFKLSSC